MLEENLTLNVENDSHQHTVLYFVWVVWWPELLVHAALPTEELAVQQSTTNWVA